MFPHDRHLLRPIPPILVIILISRSIATNYAQTDCVEPPFGYLSESWAPGTEVTVNIGPRYNEQQRADIRAVFDNWTAASGAAGNQSNVRFANFTYNPVDETTAAAPNTVNVIRISDRSTGQTQLTPGTNGRLSGANMFVPECKTENRTNSNVLRGAVAHEVGHTFGLENCTSCSPGQSIMGPGVQSVAGDICSGVWPDPDNPGGFLSGPRPCDIQASKQGYATPTPTPPSEHCLNCTLEAQEDCDMKVGFLWNAETCCCDRLFIGHTPVLVDARGDGFRLTGAATSKACAPLGSARRGA